MGAASERAWSTKDLENAVRVAKLRMGRHASVRGEALRRAAEAARIKVAAERTLFQRTLNDYHASSGEKRHYLRAALQRMRPGTKL